MQLSRLSGRRVNEYVRKEGKVWRGRHMSIRWLLGAPRHPLVDPQTNAVYMGSVASTKLDKSAVKRNRMRRRCREAFRITLKDRSKVPTVQLLLSPRSSSLKCAFEEIVADVSTFLSALSH